MYDYSIVMKDRSLLNLREYLGRKTNELVTEFLERLFETEEEKGILGHLDVALLDKASLVYLPETVHPTVMSMMSLLEVDSVALYAWCDSGDRHFYISYGATVCPFPEFVEREQLRSKVERLMEIYGVDENVESARVFYVPAEMFLSSTSKTSPQDVFYAHTNPKGVDVVSVLRRRVF